MIYVKEKGDNEQDRKIITIKYHVEGLEPVTQAHPFEWCDLRSAETVELKKGDFKLIDLGVSIALPEGYEAILAPRSSTFKNYGVIMSNSIGVIDHLYRGNEDRWMMPVYATRDTVINKNDRVCQFRIQECQPTLYFSETDDMGNENRGGLGSTGVN